MKKLLPILAILSTCALCACNDSQDIQGEELPTGDKPFEVVIDDQSKGSVDLTDMLQFAIDINAGGIDQNGIPVSDIIQKVNNLSDAELDDFLAQYVCDYESSDDEHFRPSSKGERCAMVSCSYTKMSYVNTATYRLFYSDDAPMKNGCYSVTDVGKVLMYKTSASSQKVWIYLNGEVVGREIDIDQLTKTTVDGKEAVKIADIIDKADIKVDLSSYLCDMRTDTGDKSLGDLGVCSAVSCDALKDQYIFTSDRSLSEAEATKACGAVDHIKAIYVTEQRDSYDSYEIKITLDGKTYTVDIATLTDKIVTYNSVASVKLSDILEAAGIALGDMSKYLCDYASTDGWKPSKKDTCKEVLTCDRLENSYISLVDAHKMTMEGAPANCYNVTGLGTIEITPAPENTDPEPQDPPQAESWNIEITVDGQAKATVDLVTLADKAVDKNGTAVVSVADVLAAAGVTEDLSTLYCDYIAADGWKPSKKDRCKEIRTCDDVSDIALVSHKLNIEGAETCYNVSDLAKIEISTTNPNT
ncbi:MAG: hypothetical protein IKY83_13135 [Proteobacteria bacterium]|nr:hypothetical protein [Pseudomonadota bacterium]